MLDFKLNLLQRTINSTINRCILQYRSSESNRNNEIPMHFMAGDIARCLTHDFPEDRA